MAKVKIKTKVVTYDILVAPGDTFTRIAFPRITYTLGWLTNNKAALLDMSTGLAIGIMNVQWGEMDSEPSTDLENIWTEIGYGSLNAFLDDYDFDGKEDVLDVINSSIQFA
jgi:hypothetical protein